MLALVIEVGIVVWYWYASQRAGADGRRWPLLRVGSFALGMAVVAYAVEGGIALYERDNFTVHVVQLLLLAYVAPPLLAMGMPVRLALQSAKRRTHARLLRFVHSWWARALTHPLVVLVLLSASLYAYFLTPLYRWSEEHPALLFYVDVHFLFVGFLFWSVVVSRDVLPRSFRFGTRVVLVLVCVPVDAFFGLTVGSVSKPLFGAGNTLADTQGGGDVLWGLTELFIVIALALLFVEWAREEERRAVQADRQLDAAIAAARAGADGASEGPP